jgi:subtilisin family serine protease
MNALMQLAIGTMTAAATTLAAANSTDAMIPDEHALSHEHIPNALFVRFKSEASAEVQDDLLAVVGGSIRESFWLVPGLVSIDTSLPVDEALQILARRSDAINYVEPIYIVHSFETIPNDPQYGALYGMPQIRANLAWDEHTGDQDFVIAIIDTGLDYNHQDITSNAWTNPGEIQGNGQDDDGNGYVDDIHGYDFSNNDSDPYDDNSHGTHCGGTIGGQGNNGVGVVGVNWNCRLVGVKFLSGGGSGSTEGAIAAVQYCAANQFKVSNNSWGGGGFSQSLYDGIQNAGDQFGHVFVAAAGNSGSNGASYPAAYDCTNIISVAASDSNENRASFSQYHISEVDLAAPGVDVVSTVPGNGYDSYSGTSMATPHVAGGVGLVYSVMGDSSAEEIIDLILSTVRPVSAWNGLTATGGILDVNAALEGSFLGPRFELTSTVPAELDPNTTLDVTATLDPREDVITPGSVQLYYRNTLGGWSSMEMAMGGLGTYSATVPAYDCDQASGFFLSCQGETAGTVTLPSGGSSNPYMYTIGNNIVAYDDKGETNGKWTVTSDAADGGWNRGIPINCNRGDPTADYDGSGSCWLTDNSSADGCNSDVDEGSTTLTSGEISVSNVPSGTLSYARWFHNSYGGSPYTDSFEVELSVDGGSWTGLESVGPTGSEVDGGWINVSWELSDIAPGAGTIRLRFTASDIGGDTQSVVEAGVDAILITAHECDDNPVCPGDLNGDSVVDVSDILIAIDGFGTDYQVEDILDVLAHFGSAC